MNRADAYTRFGEVAASLALLLCFGGAGNAQTLAVSVEEEPVRGEGIRTFTPVFDQIVSFVHPVEFRLVFEDVAGPEYIQQHAPKGETVHDWSELITLNGHKGIATRELTPGAFAQQVATGIQRSCPQTFAARPLGNLKISGHDAFIALVGCGTVTSATPRSETMLLVTMKGAADFFSIQWAERAAAVAQPPVLDEEKWRARFRRLGPIWICNKVPGESPPFVSCVDPG